VKETTFRYAFPADAKEVRFSVGMPYIQADLDRFLDRWKGEEHLRREILCKTKKGREVEMLRVGCTASEPRIRAAFTARHHACEMMTNYAVEGMIESILADDNVGRRLRDEVEFLILPFMDKDGVEEGDQGKSRKPHDHDRDYVGESRYETVAALKAFAPAWSKGKLRFYLDMHCPHLLGGRNLEIFFVGAPDERIWPRLESLARILEEDRKGPLTFRASNNLRFGEEWNRGDEDKTARAWFTPLVADGISASIEIPYASAGGGIVTQESARAFGRDLAAALCVYFAARD